MAGSRQRVYPDRDRSQGTVSEWLADDNWSIPDGEAMIRLPQALSREGYRVSEAWFLTGIGSSYAMPSTPGPLYYRGVLSILTELELWAKQPRLELEAEEGSLTKTAR